MAVADVALPNPHGSCCRSLLLVTDTTCLAVFAGAGPTTNAVVFSPGTDSNWYGSSSAEANFANRVKNAEERAAQRAKRAGWEVQAAQIADREGEARLAAEDVSLGMAQQLAASLPTKRRRGANCRLFEVC